jgi:prepilin-type N-terminal cleavage/methylation domain-containing protein
MPFHLNPEHRVEAFTLSELLISLSILGLISAITLPSIFNSVNEMQRISVFKETIQALTEVSTMMAYEGDTFTDITPFLEKLNLRKGCYTTEADCMSTPSVGSFSDPRGGVMLNGSIFWDLEPVSTGSEGFDNIAIDWNGHSGPNLEGQDILIVSRCVSTAASSYPCTSQMAADKVHAGSIAVNVTRPLSVSLINTIYK